MKPNVIFAGISQHSCFYSKMAEKRFKLMVVISSVRPIYPNIVEWICLSLYHSFNLEPFYSKPNRISVQLRRKEQVQKQILFSRTIPSPERTIPSPERTIPSLERTIPSPERTIPSLERTITSPDRTIPSPERTIPASERRFPTEFHQGQEHFLSGKVFIRLSILLFRKETKTGEEKMEENELLGKYLDRQTKRINILTINMYNVQCTYLFNNS